MVEWQRGGDKDCERDGVPGGGVYQPMRKKGFAETIKKEYRTSSRIVETWRCINPPEKSDSFAKEKK